jgi:hypothetical protein
MESAAGGTLAADLARPLATPRVRRARLFYPGLALAMLAVVFVGFAPTYYLKGAFGSRSLPLLFHVHGAAFTAWMLLLVAQTALVASGRTPLHRRLGVAGGGLAAIMMVLAWLMAIGMAQRAGTDEASLRFVIVPVATIVVFPLLVGAALVWRRFPATHKRLMMIATAELMSAGIGRLPGLGAFGPLGFFGGTDLAIVALLIHDRVTTGRFHPATIWGGLFLIASQGLRVVIAGTDGWLSVARWIAA